MTDVVPTAEFASLVYGAEGPSMDDPAETFHEASRLYPNVAPGRLETLLLLARNPALQQTVARSSRTHDHRPGIDLVRGALPRAPFRALLAMRKSRSAAARHRLRLRDLAAVLEASYAANTVDRSTVRRPVPSGGALYPSRSTSSRCASQTSSVRRSITTRSGIASRCSDRSSRATSGRHSSIPR